MGLPLADLSGLPLEPARATLNLYAIWLKPIGQQRFMFMPHSELRLVPRSTQEEGGKDAMYLDLKVNSRKRERQFARPVWVVRPQGANRLVVIAPTIADFRHTELLPGVGWWIDPVEIERIRREIGKRADM